MEKNLLKATWSPDGKKIAAGSGDRSVTVWETSSGKLLHKLPGHKGAVNDVRFHPGEDPISKSSSRFIVVFLTRRTFRFGGVTSACHEFALRLLRQIGGGKRKCVPFSPDETLFLQKSSFKRASLTSVFVTVVSGSSDRTLLLGELGN
jgi:WD40 repeat protein